MLTLLDDGSFTATYKYAALLGLIDLSMEGVSPDLMDSPRGATHTCVVSNLEIVR